MNSANEDAELRRILELRKTAADLELTRVNVEVMQRLQASAAGDPQTYTVRQREKLEAERTPEEREAFALMKRIRRVSPADLNPIMDRWAGELALFCDRREALRALEAVRLREEAVFAARPRELPRRPQAADDFAIVSWVELGPTERELEVDGTKYHLANYNFVAAAQAPAFAAAIAKDEERRARSGLRAKLARMFTMEEFRDEALVVRVHGGDFEALDRMRAATATTTADDIVVESPDAAATESEVQDALAE